MDGCYGVVTRELKGTDAVDGTLGPAVVDGLSGQPGLGSLGGLGVPWSASLRYGSDRRGRIGSHGE